MLTEQVQTYLTMLEGGMTEEGLELLRKSLAHPQMSDELRYDLAQELYHIGFLEEAIEVMEDLYALYPDETEVALFLAELYMEGGQEDHFVAIVSQILPEQGEDYIRAVLLEAEHYLAEGLHEVAEYKIKQGLEVYPDEPVLHTALGEVYYQLEHYSLAITSYLKGSVMSSYAKLADAYAHLGSFEEALSYYEKATATSPTPDSIFGYGFVAAQLQQWEQAVHQFELLIQQDPFYTSVYPLLVEALMKLNKREKALAIAKQGLTYDQTNPTLYDWLGRLLLQEGKVEEARASFLQATELDDQFISSLESLLSLEEEAEDWEAALQYVDRLIEIAPENGKYFIRKGKLYEELESWSDAEHCYRNAISLTNEDTEALNALAFLLRDEGQFAEAIQCWQKSIEIDPSQFDIQELLEQYE